MKIKSWITGILKGSIKSVPVVKNIAEEIEKTKLENSEHSPEGKTDWAQVIGKSMTYIIGALIIYHFLKGHVSIDDVKTLFNQLAKLGIFN